MNRKKRKKQNLKIRTILHKLDNYNNLQLKLTEKIGVELYCRKHLKIPFYSKRKKAKGKKINSLDYGICRLYAMKLYGFTDSVIKIL